jgi:hypothetical protein
MSGIPEHVAHIKVKVHCSVIIITEIPFMEMKYASTSEMGPSYNKVTMVMRPVRLIKPNYWYLFMVYRKQQCQ